MDANHGVLASPQKLTLQTKVRECLAKSRVVMRTRTHRGNNIDIATRSTSLPRCVAYRYVREPRPANVPSSSVCRLFPFRYLWMRRFGGIEKTPVHTRSSNPRAINRACRPLSSPLRLLRSGVEQGCHRAYHPSLWERTDGAATTPTPMLHRQHHLDTTTTRRIIPLSAAHRVSMEVSPSNVPGSSVCSPTVDRNLGGGFVGEDKNKPVRN